MSDMSGKICVAESNDAASRDGHAFRSWLIDKTATAERWAVERFRASGQKKELPHLLGDRMEAVRKLCRTQPKLFKNASKVANLLDCLTPYLNLRSALAHSVLSSGPTPDGDVLLTFDVAGAPVATPWQGRVAIRRSELPRVRKEVGDLINQLQHQSPDESA